MHTNCFCGMRLARSERNPKPGGRKFPTWVMPHDVQHSVPDVFQIKGLPADFKGTPRVSMDQKQNCEITIVEVKYAPDPDVQKSAREAAIAQHSDLVKSLEARGWRRITVYPVIIGNAGTITRTAHDACEALGIQAAARITLLRALSINSVRRTAAIWKPRLVKSIAQQPEPVDEPAPEPQQSAPDPRPDTEQDQQKQQSSGQAAGEAPGPDAPTSPGDIPGRTQSAPGDKGTTDATIPVDPDTWQTVPGKRRWSGQQPRSLGASPTLAGSEQTRPPKRSCNSFAVLADHPTSSDPTMHNVADADTNTATAATHSLGSAGGDSPMRQSSMTLRPKRMTKAKVVAHTTRPTKRKTSSHTAYQRASSRQRAARQQAVRPADSQSADSQPADSQSASQQQPADSKQRTHGEQAEAMATPRTDPLGKAVKRKCPPTLNLPDHRPADVLIRMDTGLCGRSVTAKTVTV